MSKEIYIKQIRLIKPDSKIILFVNKLDETYKGFLFANDIFNIIESDKATFTSIIDMIEAKGKQVIYKNAPIYNFETEFEQDNFNVITRKTISVFGATGAGKSYVSSLIAHLVSKKMKLNTLLMDMDVQNSSLDLYNARPNIKRVVDDLINGFIPNMEKEGRAIYDSLITYNDEYFVLRDLENYTEAQEKIDKLYKNREKWNQMALINIANSGIFSSDRTIIEYAEDIWFKGCE